MNKKLNLVEILKDCPEGTKFYSIVHGDIVFIKLLDLNKILFAYKDGSYYDLIIQSDGKLYNNGECIVFPSKEQRDWSKFVAPWYKKDRFDPKTLKPFDKVIMKNNLNEWTCAIFSHISDYNYGFPCNCCDRVYRYCIPYNDETKHLVGTTDEAPEYYRYWEA